MTVYWAMLRDPPARQRSVVVEKDVDDVDIVVVSLFGNNHRVQMAKANGVYGSTTVGVCGLSERTVYSISNRVYRIELGYMALSLWGSDRRAEAEA